MDRTLAGTVGVILVSAALLSPRAAQDAGTPDAKLVADFLARVKEYVALHHQLEGTLPERPLGASLELIGQHQQALEQLIRRARAAAKRGDIFTESIRPYFRRQLARALEGPDGRSIRHTIMDEDTRAVRVGINARYPDAIPLSSVPPQILLLLPRLPEELEYHFVGDRLVLLDVHARMVVDYMDKAISR